jgi:hypothetical protein
MYNNALRKLPEIYMQRILFFIMALALAACGGGPGASDELSKAKNPTGLSVTFSSPALNFSYFEGRPTGSHVVKADVTGNTNPDVWIGAEATGTAIATPIVIAVTDASRTAGFLIVPKRSLVAGTYTGTITLLVCTTPSCTQHHGGSPHKVSYVVTVLPGLTAAPSAIVLTVAENGTRAVNLALSIPPAKTAIISGITYKNTQTGWLSATINGSTVSVQAAPRSMPLGTYTADLNLKLADGSQELNVPVMLNVIRGPLVVSGVSIAADNMTPGAQ